jgi:hypothetical protein
VAPEPARLAAMDPRDHPSDPAAGIACAACERPIPPARARILAHRDDLVFADLRCPACASVSLVMIAGEALDWLRSEPPDGEAAPIGPDDVLDMHLFLAGWTGDVRSLVGRAEGAGEAADAA